MKILNVADAYQMHHHLRVTSGIAGLVEMMRIVGEFSKDRTSDACIAALECRVARGAVVSRPTRTAVPGTGTRTDYGQALIP